MIINATPSPTVVESDENSKSSGSGGGQRGGYVGMMNCVFAAQKAVRPSRNIAILMQGAHDVAESPDRRLDAPAIVRWQSSAHIPTTSRIPH